MKQGEVSQTNYVRKPACHTPSLLLSFSSHHFLFLHLSIFFSIYNYAFLFTRYRSNLGTGWHIKMQTTSSSPSPTPISLTLVIFLFFSFSTPYSPYLPLYLLDFPLFSFSLCKSFIFLILPFFSMCFSWPPPLTKP